MSLLSYAYASLAAACLSAAPASPDLPIQPTRVLLLQDSRDGSAAVSMVHRALQTDLLTDPTHQLLTPRPPSIPETVAADLQTSALADMAAGLQAFHALQLDEASDRYSAAVQKLHRVAALTGDVSELPSALSMLAATLLLVNEPQAATPILARLRALQPQFSLASAQFNPETAALARQLTRAAPTQHPLRLQAIPASSTLWLDGHCLGQDTVMAPVDPSIPHYVFITHGSATQSAVIDPTPAPPDAYTFTLPDALAPAATSANEDDAYAAILNAARSTRAFPNPQATELQLLGADEVWVLRSTPSSFIECNRFDLASGHRTDLTLPSPSNWTQAHHAANACRDAAGPSE